MSKIGGFIKEIRKEEGLNITELANKAGISRPYLSQIESGKRIPSNDLLLQISRALDVSYSVMLQMSGQEGMSNSVMYAQAEYNDLVNRIEEEQEDGSLAEFVQSLRLAFNYSIYDVAEMSDLPISEIKLLESNDTDEINKFLSKEMLYKLSKCYDKKLFNVYYALLERARFVEHPEFNSVDMLRDNTGTIDSLQEVEELLVSGERGKVNLIGLQGQKKQTSHLDKILSNDDAVYFNEELLTTRERNMLGDFIELLIKHRDND